MAIERHLSALELAELLGVSTDMVYRAVHAGELQGVRLGGSRNRGSGILRFPESEIEKYLAAQRKASVLH